MPLTEGQAREKWCPMVRHSGEDNITDNSYFNDRIPPYARCIASECMMWRTVRERVPAKQFPPEQGIYDEVERGYCGLAGKPEV
jgi:hypothetical protein